MISYFLNNVVIHTVARKILFLACAIALSAYFYRSFSFELWTHFALQKKCLVHIWKCFFENIHYFRAMIRGPYHSGFLKICWILPLPLILTNWLTKSKIKAQSKATFQYLAPYIAEIHAIINQKLNKVQNNISTKPFSSRTKII